MPRRLNGAPRRRFSRVVAFSIIAFLTLAGCGGSGRAVESPAGESETESLPEIRAVSLAPTEKLAVVASTSIVGDVVAAVAGDAVGFTVLIRAGQDPHSYDPAPSAVGAIERADIVFVNGFGLEEALLKVVKTVATGYIVPVSAGIEPLRMRVDDEDTIDPHVWFAPKNVKIWVVNIEHALRAADPARADFYHARSRAYLDRLDVLDSWMRERLAAVPEERRRLVSDHELFGYFAREYGFELSATILRGTSASAQPSARRIADLVALLRREGITTIFVGETAGPGVESIAGAISDELGEKVRVVRLLTGSLTPRGTFGDTYIGYMEYNVDRIVDGLK